MIVREKVMSIQHSLDKVYIPKWQVVSGFTAFGFTAKYRTFYGIIFWAIRVYVVG